MLLLGFLFLSATGLTWSQLAGDNIANLRTSLDWTTPKLPTALSPAAAAPAAGSEHDHSHAGTAAAGTDPAMYDHVLAAARQEPVIDAGKVEIKPPAKAGKAWTVTEIDRSWPTQADAAAVDPATMTVSGKLVFNDFNLAAKLTRWGIDAHMGVLFGLANQLVLVVIALGLAGSVIGGYLMWWKRRPTRGTSWAAGRPPARRFLRTAPWPLTAAVADPCPRRRDSRPPAGHQPRRVPGLRYRPGHRQEPAPVCRNRHALSRRVAAVAGTRSRPRQLSRFGAGCASRNSRDARRAV